MSKETAFHNDHYRTQFDSNYWVFLEMLDNKRLQM